MSPPILATHDGPVTTLTLNRPDKRNALNADLLEQLCAAIASATAEPGQRVLILRGAGRVFCAGLDLAEASQPGQAAIATGLLGKALHSLATNRLITIAAVQGAAVAGGAGLVSACDFVVAMADAKFGYPELRRGLVPAIVMTLLRRQLKERDARELLLLGKLIDAGHARAIGLINRVAADTATFDNEVSIIVSSLLQGAPHGLGETKKLLAELWPVPLEADLARAHAYHASALDSAEMKEGISAFHEKRAPKWAPSGTVG